MKVIKVEQNTPEWYQARLGIVTASEMDSLVTPLWKPKTGDGVETYLARKLAERWLGRPLMRFSGGAMEQGTWRENEGLGRYGVDVLDGTGLIWKTVGFVTSDDGKIGCSPDALVVSGGPGVVFEPVKDTLVRGIEAKCPELHTHVKYLLDDEDGPTVPKDYRAQVQGAMLVTGAPSWTFLSYARNFPMLVIEVERDEKAISVLREAIGEFNARLDEAYEKLLALNDGKKPKHGKEVAQWNR